MANPARERTTSVSGSQDRCRVPSITAPVLSRRLRAFRLIECATCAFAMASSPYCPAGGCHLHNGAAQWTKDRANHSPTPRRYVAKVQWLLRPKCEALCGMPTLHTPLFPASPSAAVTLAEAPITRLRNLMRG